MKLAKQKMDKLSVITGVVAGAAAAVAVFMMVVILRMSDVFHFFAMPIFLGLAILIVNCVRFKKQNKGLAITSFVLNSLSLLGLIFIFIMASINAVEVSSTFEAVMMVLLLFVALAAAVVAAVFGILAMVAKPQAAKPAEAKPAVTKPQKA